MRAETTAYAAAGAAGVLVAPEAGGQVAVAAPKGRGAYPASSGHRRDIQGLRAIAVITVIADHAGVGFLAGGYVGVDVFFVLSGFLITSLLVREAERSGRIGLLGFYARRARLFLPAATVVLVATLAFTAAQLSYTRVQQVTTDVGWASAFLANVRFSTLGTDYFAEGLPPSPVQHYWSLAVEEQFYLVWPLLLLGLVLLARRRSAGRTHLHLGLTVAVVAVLSVASFTWSLHLTGDNQTTAYFSSAGRAWELGIGALLAVAASRLQGTTPWVPRVLAAGGLAAVLTAVVAFDATTRFPGWACCCTGHPAAIAAGILQRRRRPGPRPRRASADLGRGHLVLLVPLALAGAGAVGRA